MSAFARRFEQLEIHYAEVANRVAVKLQWKRRARQEAVNRSGACEGGLCYCPNCKEYRDVVSMARDYERRCGATPDQAWYHANHVLTQGAATTIWCNPGE